MVHRLLSTVIFGLFVVGSLAFSGCDAQSGSNSNGSSNPPSGSISGQSAQVVRIIDGDTIDVRMNGQTYRVRYIGMNTPERDQPCYSEATQANADLVEGQTVTLVRDVSETDQYGRLLRYVYAGNTFVNAELVTEGFAEAKSYPPDTTYYDYFRQLENAAQAAGLGCHPTGVFNH